MNYQEYPKWLYHPGESPAVISDDSEAGAWQIGHSARPGRAALFPPVLVHNPDQEAYYRSRGYAGDAGNAAAFQRAQIAPLPTGYAYQQFPQMTADGRLIAAAAPVAVDREYPKWVTPAGGEPRIVNSRTEERLLCPPPAPSSAEQECVAAILAAAEESDAEIPRTEAQDGSEKAGQERQGRGALRLRRPEQYGGDEGVERNPEGQGDGEEASGRYEARQAAVAALDARLAAAVAADPLAQGA